MFWSADPGALGAFFQVIVIDLVLAGDNAVVIGLAAAGLPPEIRRKAILVGIMAATVLRISLAVITTQLLSVTGLLLAGGLLLLWVCWKMWQELQEHGGYEAEGHEVLGDGEAAAAAPKKKVKSFRQAFTQIMVADISMSLDNVLAVAGAAREHPFILAFGLVLSIAMMGLAASLIAKLLNKHRWIAYVGLVIILFVAFRMILHGTEELAVAFGWGWGGHG